MGETQAPHVAMFPSPGIGHLIPQVEVAKRLVQLHGFSVTFLVPGDGPPPKAQKAFLDSLPEKMNYVALPPANLDDLLPETKMESRICLINSRSQPYLRDALSKLMAENRVVAFVTDLFGTDCFYTAEELKLPAYLFFPSTAMVLSLFLYLPQLDQEVDCEYRDMTGAVWIPGCVPIHGRDLLDPVQDRKDEVYKHLLEQVKRYRMARGIMVNSFEELEPGALKALQDPEPGKPPVYPVGPLIQMGPSGSGSADDASGSLSWLDGQPAESVLFVSFGSGGTLTYAQLTELAFGLEVSEQRFIWVVKTPSDTAADAAFFGVKGQSDPLAFLPEGFLDRVKGRGFVVPSWGPQVQILGHRSTGGFLSHCGWNSILESVSNGVPMIAWPLYAEQKMNAVTVTEVVRVALRSKPNEHGLVERAEVARVVKRLMEGEEGKQAKGRAMKLKEAAQKTLGPDGSSAKALTEVARQWKSHLSNTA